MKQKAEIECNYVETNDNFNLTLLDIEIQKINDMMSSNVSNDGIQESLIHISKWMGSWLNPTLMTAKEYFILLKQMEKINKQN